MTRQPVAMRRIVAKIGSSSITDDNGVIAHSAIEKLCREVAELVAQARAAQPASEAFIVHRPEQEGVRVERSDDGAFVVLGRPAERAVAVTDLTNADASRRGSAVSTPTVSVSSTMRSASMR